ncbi:MAG: 4-alpha-glucanotransferase [Candidatus Omnitrophota bacterium]|nr:4-alpha-glucanotransferase [Candidatus Omnitrophota bacterium]
MEKILKRRAGVLVPLFSIYSDDSLGVGDLEDLKLLIDWCAKTGYSIIQLLPMSEVGSTFCPYDSISSFALEPMYMRLKPFGSGKAPVAQERSSRVDYRMKEEKLRILWDSYTKEKSVASNKEFSLFVEDNSYWIDDYSIFKALKSYHNQAPWYEWNDGYKDRDNYVIEQFKKEHKIELDFYKWIQWILFKQFRDVKKHAELKKVLIKGDLPILVSRDSADVWAHPDFFKLEFAAGAPPDMYCAKGQRWGMPTYNWDYIKADEFIYIKEKLKYAQNFYDILRIDHVVGLFRIWSIPCNEPMENQGLNGFFDPGDENVWGSHGRDLLSVFQENTSIALCAEDLGIIPKVCRDTLADMGIPGNDVQRWMKDWQVSHDFLKPDGYRKLSAAMLSTHDTTNWAAWWENEAGTVDEELFIRKCNERGIDYRTVKERFFCPDRSKHGRLRWREDVASVERYIEILGKRPEELRDFIELYENTYLEKEKLWKGLELKGPMREKCDAKIMRAALDITASSSSIFCIELIFDLLSLADLYKEDPYKCRVNFPGTVSPQNWSLKIPISLEELSNHKINKDLKEILTVSGRI